MRTISFTFTAGETKSLTLPGRYLRVLAGSAGTLDIEFFRNNAGAGEKAVGVDAGYYAMPEGGFDRLDITSSSAQTIKLAVSNGSGGYDRTVGSVDVLTLPMTGAVTQAQATVTTTSAQLLAAKAARRYVAIQNNDTTGIVYVTLDGTASTAAKGIKINPGASFIMDSFLASSAVNAIGSIAGNANVVVVEG